MLYDTSISFFNKNLSSKICKLKQNAPTFAIDMAPHATSYSRQAESGTYQKHFPQASKEEQSGNGFSVFAERPKNRNHENSIPH